MRRLLLAAAVASASWPAVADYESAMRELTQGLPGDVRELIHRLVDCNHWGGEEAYDDDRAKEIDAAMTELRCDALERDEREARHRHNAATEVIRALDRARELLF